MGVPLALDDTRLPLCEVLRYACMPWTTRAVSRRFCTELEAGREALRINWLGVGDTDPHHLRAMLSRLPQLKSLDGRKCPPHLVASLASLALPQLTSLMMFECNVTHLAPFTACTGLRNWTYRFVARLPT